MIFNNCDSSATDNLTFSLRDFPKRGSVSTGVELLLSCLLEILTYRNFMQRGQNIAIQINTEKEFVADLTNDQDHDMDKTEVTREVRGSNVRD